MMIVVITALFAPDRVSQRAFRLLSTLFAPHD